LNYSATCNQIVMLMMDICTSLSITHLHIVVNSGQFGTSFLYIYIFFYFFLSLIFIYFTTITKQVIQRLLIMLIGTDVCILMVFVWKFVFNA